MLIVADENIPYAADALGEFGEVRLRQGRSISRSDVADAGALIVRSITRVDRGLLEGSRVRFVGTATIGTDHVDLEYLRAAGIRFADAAGCNSVSVAEYVTAALLELDAGGSISPASDTLGVVGAGRIGEEVMRRARALGLRVAGYDPPRAGAEPGFVSASLEELLECPILTLHVPLVGTGPFPTYRMIDEAFLDAWKGGVLINTSRGDVVDSNALIAAGSVRGAVLDVWEGEPDVPAELIERCSIATPHIAGYSFDGKLRGTAMMAAALARHLGTRSEWRLDRLLGSAGAIRIPPRADSLSAAREAVRAAYDITEDDRALRAVTTFEPAARARGFDTLRKEYRRRREFHAWEVDADPGGVLSGLGFTVRGGAAPETDSAPFS